MITLYELKGAGDRRYSLFSWRTRMALKHKGLPFETVGVPMSDKAAIEFSGGRTVPVIRDAAAVVRDSWAIAQHLEVGYPQGFPLFGGPIGQGLTFTFNTWVDRVVVPAMVPVVVADVFARIDPVDREHYRANMEKYLGRTIEEAGVAAPQALERFSKTADPVRSVLKRQPWISGPAPAYADYVFFSVLQWARIMCPVEVLPASDDPLRLWRERVLDLHGGYARDVKTA